MDKIALLIDIAKNHTWILWAVFFWGIPWCVGIVVLFLWTLHFISIFMWGKDYGKYAGNGE